MLDRSHRVWFHTHPFQCWWQSRERQPPRLRVCTVRPSNRGRIRAVIPTLFLRSPHAPFRLLSRRVCHRGSTRWCDRHNATGSIRCSLGRRLVHLSIRSAQPGIRIGCSRFQIPCCTRHLLWWGWYDRYSGGPAWWRSKLHTHNQAFPRSL